MNYGWHFDGFTTNMTEQQEENKLDFLIGCTGKVQDEYQASTGKVLGDYWESNGKVNIDCITVKCRVSDCSEGQCDPDPSLWRSANTAHSLPLIQTCSNVHCTARHYTALHCSVLGGTVLRCTALHCTVLRCTSLGWTSLRCTALRSTALLWGPVQYRLEYCVLKFLMMFYSTLHFIVLLYSTV